MVIIVLTSIIAAPLVLLALMLFHSKCYLPHKTALEQLVIFLAWLAKWVQAISEALDSGLACYRDAMHHPISCHAEQARRIRDMERRNREEERVHAEQARKAAAAQLTGHGRPGRLWRWLP